MGNWGYNPCKWSYFTLLIRGFWVRLLQDSRNLLDPLLTQGGHKSKFIWTVPGCLLLQYVSPQKLGPNVHPKTARPISSQENGLRFQSSFFREDSLVFTGSSVLCAHIAFFSTTKTTKTRRSWRKKSVWFKIHSRNNSRLQTKSSPGEVPYNMVNTAIANLRSLKGWC